MQNQPEPGHCCPLVMTFAAVPAIRASAAAAASAATSKGLSEGSNGWHGQWEAALTSGEYDGRDLPLHLKRGATVGLVVFVVVLEVCFLFLRAYLGHCRDVVR